MCLYKGVTCYLSPRYCCTISYRFALACYGKCRKKMILEYFYESTNAESNGFDCCAVNFSVMVDGQQGMIAIARVVNGIPCKGVRKWAISRVTCFHVNNYAAIAVYFDC